MKTAEQVLAEAADHIEYVGWFQLFAGKSQFGPPEQQQCVLVALDRACPDRHMLWGVVMEAMRKETGWEHLDDWNDVRGRTRHEVAAALRNAKRWL